MARKNISVGPINQFWANDNMKLKHRRDSDERSASCDHADCTSQEENAHEPKHLIGCHTAIIGRNLPFATSPRRLLDSYRSRKGRPRLLAGNPLKKYSASKWQFRLDHRQSGSNPRAFLMNSRARYTILRNMVAATVMSFSSVSVMGNSLRLRTAKLDHV